MGMLQTCIAQWRVRDIDGPKQLEQIQFDTSMEGKSYIAGPKQLEQIQFDKDGILVGRIVSKEENVDIHATRKGNLNLLDNYAMY